MPHDKSNGGAVLASNLKILEMCEGGPYELRGFLIRMIDGAPQVVGSLKIEIDSTAYIAPGWASFTQSLKQLMRQPGEVEEINDPGIVQRIDRSKFS